MSPEQIEIVWRYEVVPEREDEFLELYGPDGGWARLFATDPAYLGTELVRDADREHVYLTLDHWRDRVAYETFMAAHAADYAALDARGAQLTLGEERIGVFATLSESFQQGDRS